MRSILPYSQSPMREYVGRPLFRIDGWVYSRRHSCLHRPSRAERHGPAYADGGTDPAAGRSGPLEEPADQGRRGRQVIDTTPTGTSVRPSSLSIRLEGLTDVSLFLAAIVSKIARTNPKLRRLCRFCGLHHRGAAQSGLRIGANEPKAAQAVPVLWIMPMGSGPIGMTSWRSCRAPMRRRASPGRGEVARFRRRNLCCSAPNCLRTGAGI